MMHETKAIGDATVASLLARERASFIRRNPNSQALAGQARQHWLGGVPMLWMNDWDTPFPLSIERASGVDLTDVDGNRYIDFCLGDTGAMFGHGPRPIATALRKQATLGLTTMMPSPDAPAVGKLLADRFQLPYWQVTATASDANRSVLRWSRAVTGRNKILIFNGCYHGAVDETFVTLHGAASRNDPGLIGEPRDLTRFTKVVEFNDLDALTDALREEDVACVLTEPVMTNCGMILPDEGFHEALRRITRQTGTLLIIDETHCLSSGPGGYSSTFALDPDAIVLGKPIAGGVPAAAYGVSAAFMERIADVLSARRPGHSGLGTTLAGSALQLGMMRHVLETYLTAKTFEPMFRLAEGLETGILTLIRKHKAPWHVVRVGARVEFMCTPRRPRNGSEARAVVQRPIDKAVHHYLLNRGLLITPFHNMMLICPATRKVHVDALLAGMDECLAELMVWNR
ncbi:MAG TPA: aspartate aminotransferase family protein [Aestuariivirgaceae bacterium]